MTDGRCVVYKSRAVGMTCSVIPILSPWFKPSDPPVRTGIYQLKDWIGRITEADWDGAHFQRGGLRINTATIRCWRGVVR